jgi:transposase
MPATTLLDIPLQEQEQMLAALRRAHYGYLLALHILLLCARGRNPTAIAAVLFCSRSSVYRVVRLYRTGQLGFTVDADGQLAAPVRTTVLLPVVQRSLAALLKAPPRAYGWCRTRWSCATLAAQLTAKHGLAVSAWTVRRWLHELGWVWKRAKLVAKDDDPQRVERLAKPRHDSSRIEGEHDAEPHPAAVHLFIGFRHPAQRIWLNHRVHSAQHAECQRLLRIPRGAGIPTCHRSPSTDERHHTDRQRLSRRGRHQQGAAGRQSVYLTFRTPFPESWVVLQ